MEIRCFEEGPGTTISFDLPENQRVELRVYDLLGREVTTLLDHEVSSGSHEVKWDGTDGQGIQMSSGVYFYRIQTPTRVAFNKMLLVR